MKTRVELLWLSTDDYNQPVDRATHFDVADEGRLHELLTDLVKQHGPVTAVRTFVLDHG